MAASSAGAVVVPIYPTNSPEECLWVISDSEASAIVCENDEQLAKIAAIRDRLPHLRTIIMIEPVTGDPMTNGALDRPSLARDDHAGGRAQARACPPRGGARSAPRRSESRGSVDVHLHLWHHRATEGMRAHARQLSRDHRHDLRGRGDSQRRGHLPLPPARPLLRPARPARGVRPRQHAGLLRGRHQADSPRADGGRTDLPAIGPTHLREGLHARSRRRSKPSRRRSASVRRR